MTLIDIGCWERGCACYDSRIKDETVEVVRREWVGLTDEEVKAIVWSLPYEPSHMDIRAIEAKLRSKNT